MKKKKKRPFNIYLVVFQKADILKDYLLTYLFMVTPEKHGSWQARDRIRATTVTHSARFLTHGAAEGTLWKVF